MENTSLNSYSLSFYPYSRLEWLIFVYFCSCSVFFFFFCVFFFVFVFGILTHEGLHGGCSCESRESVIALWRHEDLRCATSDNKQNNEKNVVPSHHDDRERVPKRREKRNEERERRKERRDNWDLGTLLAISSLHCVASSFALQTSLSCLLPLLLF